MSDRAAVSRLRVCRCAIQRLLLEAQKDLLTCAHEDRAHLRYVVDYVQGHLDETYPTPTRSIK